MKIIFIILFYVFMIFQYLPIFGKVLIEKIEIAEDRIKNTETQLIELHIKNEDRATQKIRGRVKIHLPNNSIIIVKGDLIQIGKGETRATILAFNGKGNVGGIYKVEAFLLDRKNKIIFSTPKNEFPQFFVIAEKNQTIEPSKQIVVDLNNLAKDGGFELADITIAELEIKKTDLLRGEDSSVLFTVTNQGGDIVKSIQWEMYVVIEFLLGKQPGQLVRKGVIPLLSPGESKFFEIPLFIDTEERPGSYFVHAVIDPDKKIADSNQKNNVKTSINHINFSDIALVYPEDRESVSFNGDLTFRWRSKKYEEFFVEISGNESFKKSKNIFRLPLDTPIQKKTITVLSVEKRIGLLQLQNESNEYYWRIKGVNNEDSSAYSFSRKLYVGKEQ